MPGFGFGCTRSYSLTAVVRSTIGRTSGPSLALSVLSHWSSVCVS